MDIVEESNKTLSRLENNDPGLTSLDIVSLSHTLGDRVAGRFWMHNGADLLKLGNAIGNNEHLTLISFHESLEWTLDTAPLFEGLQRNSTIRNLSLHGSIGIGILNEYVANISSLTRIGILSCDLRGGVAGSLAQAVHMFPNLNIIALCHCKIDDASLKAFALGIKGLSCLQEMYLLSIDEDPTNGYTGCINGTKGAKAIATLLQDPNCNISHLELSSFGFHNNSIQIIVNGLIGNAKLASKLASLNLSFHAIQRSGCESIINLLQSPSCNITSLDLRWCEMNNESLTKIVSCLIGNTKLTYLDLSRNIIGKSCSESIVSLLQHHSGCNLTELHLGGCIVNNNRWLIKIVGSLIDCNTKLMKLDLSDNIIGLSGCEYIATLLKAACCPNSNIRKMNLSNCKVIDDECVTLLARSLVGNTKLECLDLSGNPDITIGSGWNAFISIFLNYSNTTLHSLGKEDSGEDFVPDCLATLLKLNLAVDMEPLIELDAEDGERQPKALPHVIDWFGRRARETTRNRLVPKCIRTRKLSAIFQFARAMPLSFAATPFDVEGKKKKKRKRRRKHYS